MEDNIVKEILCPYKEFFLKASDLGIKVIVFKSSKNLEKALCGEGDIDIYIPIEKEAEIKIILNETGFYKLLPSKTRRYKNVYDYINYCNDKKRFCHLHIHFELLIGPDYAKEIIYPVSKSITENYRIFKIYGQELKILPLHIESQISTIRLFFKIRLTDLIFLKDKTKKLLRELIDLGKEKNKNILLFELQHSLLKNRVTCKNYLTLYKYSKNYISFNWTKYLLLKFKEVKNRMLIRFQRYLGVKEKGMYCSGQGLVIAIAGSDGSGKSTLVKSIRTELAMRHKTITLHFGKPVNFWGFASRILSSILGKITLNFKLLDGFVKLLTAKGRVKVSRKAERYRRWGYMIILDRLFLLDLRLDGGEDIEFLKQRFGECSWIYRYVNNLYANIINPDICCILNVDINTASLRRPNDCRKELEKKINKVQNFTKLMSSKHLKYNDICKYIIIPSNIERSAIHNKLFSKVIKKLKDD